ncbi:LUD domain-containing protein [Aequorivita sp. F47161]|uniref:LUD domain-containing protein n=2 Tax=Bacteria TaxID=2 RepID=A0A9X1QVD9_9FLAO|nr:LUD domain-containing protein [Aequorivita vitellina]MCG2418132.1 LUD domain-containing protein [Aequorivita vitellina]MCZ4318016.1 LUD domain-containing protein [Aequorivita viscosa]
MSLFKRLLNPNYKKSDEKAKKAQKAEHSSYYPEQKLPVDEKFTFNFKKNGGKFIYCENWEEVTEAFDNIMLENDWYEQDVFCFNEQLCQKFDGFNLNFGNSEAATFFLSSCESLIANNGSILLSSNQIKEKKLKELPFNIIIFATTSQLVDTISEGLRTIKNQSSGYIPSNITTIQDFETEKEKDFMSYGSSTKNLYLLLLEDL